MTLPQMPLSPNPPELLPLLQSVFGFAGFRTNQQAVCEASAAGEDVLLVMPTGAGKSLCYQLPALARGGCALVISPLIALMEDQAQKLESLGLRVGRIHSGMDRERSRQVCRQYLDGDLQFLFIAPERLRVPGFVEMLRKGRLALIAVDEAHCISQWGHDFRPDYRNLARHIETLRPAPVIALTATATPQVQRDIVNELRLVNAREFIHGFRRTNLAVEVAEVSKPRRRAMAKNLLAARENRPAIVYAPSRKEAEEVAAELKEHFPTAVYHAGLPPALRDTVQREFLSGTIEVVVATIAFGMGIDKADVRTVIHMAMPASVESYYQEIGRAGRDGLPSRAILLYSYQDRRMHEFFLERDYPPAGTLERIAARLSAIPVHADDLRLSLKLDMDSFAPALDKLLAQGAAEIDFNGYLVATASAAREWRDGYEAQVNFRRGQIDAMMNFAAGAGCRMAALIRHFGDQSDGMRICGQCDVCRPTAAVAQSFRGTTAEDEREMRRVLRELARVPSKSTGKLYTELHPKGNVERRDFDALLDALSRAGYVRIESATFESKADGREIAYRKAAITHEGREVDEGAALVGVQLREAVSSPSSRRQRERAGRAATPGDREMESLTAAQKRTEAALKAWRLTEARTLKQPAFCILGDRVLHSIVAEEPRSPEELQRVKGVGPAKVARWGDAICEVIADPEAALYRYSEAAVPAEPGRERRRPSHTSLPAPASATKMGSAAAHRMISIESAQQGPDSAARDSSLSQALKVWRMHEAKRLEMAPFVLMRDTTVHAIAEAEPLDLSALRRVNGVESTWAERFGHAVCDVVRQHARAM